MYNMHLLRTKAGFTLIELLIVVSLSIMLMLGASTMFMAVLISNTKLSSSHLVKSEGTFALNQMEFLLRNAVELVPNGSGETCAEDMDVIGLVSSDGQITYLFAEEDDGFYKIASRSGRYLTSEAVELVDGPTFDCTEAIGGASQYITISFTLRKGTPGVDKPRDIVEQTFTSSVTLRSI